MCFIFSLHFCIEVKNCITYNYIYSSTLLKYKFQVLYLSLFVLLTSVHLSDNFSYYLLNKIEISAFSELSTFNTLR